MIVDTRWSTRVRPRCWSICTRTAAVLQPLRAPGRNRRHRRRRRRRRPRALEVLSRARLRNAPAQPCRAGRLTMPTARELLEQADALMRRNRATRDDMSPCTMRCPARWRRRSRRRSCTRAGDFPVLTDTMRRDPAAGAGRSADAGRARCGSGPGRSSGMARRRGLPIPTIGVRRPARSVDRRRNCANVRRRHRHRNLRRPEDPRERRTYRADARARRCARRFANRRRPEPAAADALADVPVLTDAIAEIDAALLAVTDGGRAVDLERRGHAWRRQRAAARRRSRSPRFPRARDRCCAARRVRPVEPDAARVAAPPTS